MADVQTTTGRTWGDLDERYPELEFRELHDGMLLVNPAQGWWHQRAGGRLSRRLSDWTGVHGGEVLMAPVDIVAGEHRVYQPAVWLLLGELLDRLRPPEYWFVDLQGRRVLVDRLDGGVYGPPEIVDADGTLTTPLLPGFALRVKGLFD